MPRQFVGASKLPGAAFPGTFVGFFSWERQKKEGRGRGRKQVVTFPLLLLIPASPSAHFP